MTDQPLCPHCGAKLPSSSPEGICPKCLLNAGFESKPESVPNVADPNRLSPGEMPTESLAVKANTPSPAKKFADLPEPGQRFGNYLLIRTLGQGGMGAVFEADDLQGGRRIALKLLSHSLESPEARNRFFREGRLAASVNHPNSVYVYGTEEIDGTPAISMELIKGGTMQDRVRELGPYRVTEAVDAILQIIDGLEAAADAGVLHRDVKPSNCFVAADGTVKVGDFGLSISTSVRSETQVTTPGSFLGTPAFSSPEQLRGDELDIRSDIYAVGVTLFYLLTGRTPFDADNMVKLLATVLEQPAPSPSISRPEIPQRLARIVLRCLAKQPAERFRNYAELRAALIPYNSTAPKPATLALRFAAGICDQFIWTVAVMSIQLVVFRGDFAAMADPASFNSRSMIGWVTVALMAQVLYYAIPEGLWGASLGKTIFRLRVVDRDRNVIGIPRAVGRTLIYVMFPNLIIWLYWIFSSATAFDFAKMQADITNHWWMILVAYSYYFMLALLFSTARRHNGYAGLHDLAVGSRVILRLAHRTRPALLFDEKPLPDVQDQERIGPYHVLDVIEENEKGEFLLGYDTRMLRRVLIHRQPAGTRPIPTGLKNMGRVGRLRWINGRRDGDECWDAYEALTGKPLLQMLDEPHPWSVVRYWLLDIAQELNIAATDGTLPKFSLDRVWITADGRAKLLDFPAPGTSQGDTQKNAKGNAKDKAAQKRAETMQAGEFLVQVANASLLGAAGTEPVASAEPPELPLPIEARKLLAKIPETERLDGVVVELQRLVERTPRVTRARRVAMLVATIFMPIFFASFAAFGMYMLNGITSQHPEMSELRNVLMMMDWNRQGNSFYRDQSQEQLTREEEFAALEIFIAGKHRKTISDHEQWDSFMGLMIPPQQRSMAEKIIAEHPEPSAAELEEATAKLAPAIKRIDDMNNVTTRIPILAIFAMQFAVTWFMFVAAPGLILALACRRGLIMFVFGVDSVTRFGRPASRLRMFWRALVFHTPIVLAGPIAVAMLLPLVKQVTPLLLAILGVLAVLAISSLLLQRGLIDRLSGTYLVPR